VILIAALAFVAIVTRMTRQNGAGRHFARAIAAGEAQGIIDEEGAAEDQNLADDERAAGELWAQHHRAASSAGCPGYSPAFLQGCLEAMKAPGP
jgi:hypothetical protein